MGIDLLYVALAWSASRNFDAVGRKAARAIFVMYAVRYVTQHVFFLPEPAGLVWSRPELRSFGLGNVLRFCGEWGVPSLTIYYAHIQDFFYSGHVGFCTLAALYFRERGHKRLERFAAIQVPYQAFVVLVTRCHYSADVLAGVLFAHYFWLVA